MKKYFARNIEWLITSKCNQNCLHCCYSNFMKRDKEIPSSDIISWVDNLRSFGIQKITFTGGEPFLKRGFRDILIYTYKNGIEIHIDTNGSFSFRDAQLVSHINATINISLDGSNPEVHDVFRRKKGSFERACNSIRLLQQYDIPYKAVTVLNKINIRDIENIYQLMKKLNVNNWLVVPIKWRGKAINNRNKLFISNEEEDEILLQILKLEREEAALLIRSVLNRNFFEKSPSPLKYCCEVDRVSLGCHVCPDGSVFGCIWLPRMTYVGNLKRKSPRELWDSLDELNLFNMPIEKLRGCSKCSYKNICGGGCRAEALRLTGDILARDPTACRRMRLLTRYISEVEPIYLDRIT